MADNCDCSMCSDRNNPPVPTEDHRLAVKKGAAWLDEVRPGWIDAIDVAQLDISSGACCILGQVFADEADEDWCSGYDYAINHWEEVRANEDQLGFNGSGFRGLTRAWIDYIEGRS